MARRGHLFQQHKEGVGKKSSFLDRTAAGVVDGIYLCGSEDCVIQFETQGPILFTEPRVSQACEGILLVSNKLQNILNFIKFED